MIEFYSAPTPNGYKVAIMLEELGVPYDLKVISFSDGDQHKPAFLKINPNAKIPAIVDKEPDNFAVFESGAVLVYLAEKFGQFMPEGVKGRSEALQWVFWQVGGLGPMMGQAVVFRNYFDEKIPSVISRYENETARLFGVLETRLGEADFLASDYSIADMACWPWVHFHDVAGITLSDYPNLKRWHDTILARPAVQRGLLRPPRKTDANRIKAAKTMLVK